MKKTKKSKNSIKPKSDFSKPPRNFSTTDPEILDVLEEYSKTSKKIPNSTKQFQSQIFSKLSIYPKILQSVYDLQVLHLSPVKNQAPNPQKNLQLPVATAVAAMLKTVPTINLEAAEVRLPIKVSRPLFLRLDSSKLLFPI